MCQKIRGQKKKIEKIELLLLPVGQLFLAKHCIAIVKTTHFNLQYFSSVILLLLRVLQCCKFERKKTCVAWKKHDFFSSLKIDKSGFLVEEKRVTILLGANFSSFSQLEIG
jgi:hypothetical protein